MLFTDANISTIADLIGYESELQQVADACGMDLEIKLQLAQTEIGLELQAALARSGARSVTLEHVVVTDGLRLWHTFHTLAITYADAHNRKLNDKYLLKWNEYKALEKWAQNLYYSMGAGVAVAPIPAPGKPNASWAAGGSAEETAYFVCVAWVNAQEVESATGETVSVCVPAGNQLVVSVSGLESPAIASGWFPYVGTRPSEQRRQTSAPLSLDVDWSMPAELGTSGRLADGGQPPDYYRRLERVIQRG